MEERRTVAELKKELAARGLSQTGRKADLAERLLRATQQDANERNKAEEASGEENADPRSKDAAEEQHDAAAKVRRRRRGRAKAERSLAALAANAAGLPADTGGVVADDNVEVEYVPEQLASSLADETFAAVLERFSFRDADADAEAKEGKQDGAGAGQEREAYDPFEEARKGMNEAEAGEEGAGTLSKRKLRLLSRLTVAELKQRSAHAEVVEVHDVNARDPTLLIELKSTRNSVPVPRHWCQKRKYLQNKIGTVKAAFELPQFIRATGIAEMREALQEKEERQGMRGKMREKARPKVGKINIDYQKLHDAFFRYQTKPRMTGHGDLYYENKETEIHVEDKRPGTLSVELRRALGIYTEHGPPPPPPWLIAMQRYGPPPSYPRLRIPGLSAPIPRGASYGYHPGGWGKPPVDENGVPLYGPVFAAPSDDNAGERGAGGDGGVRTQLWGELEPEEDAGSSDEESSSEGGESEHGAGEEAGEEESTARGIATPGGLATPSGTTSVASTLPAGLETPDAIELRKRRERIEADMDAVEEEPRPLYTVVPEKAAAGMRAQFIGSERVYDLKATADEARPKPRGDAVEVSLAPEELAEGGVDADRVRARYEAQVAASQEGQAEDFSDMVAEHAARQAAKRKAKEQVGQTAKKYKGFKF